MTRLLLALTLGIGMAAAQSANQSEDESLRQALGEAGNSPVEFTRALESHLEKFPNSARKPELEKALLKTAVDLRDDARIIKYGERVLARDPDNTAVLGNVSTALLHKDDKTSAQQALEYARHFEKVLASEPKHGAINPEGPRQAAKHKEEVDRNKASALLLQARAEGLLGNTGDAVDLAKSSYTVFPSVEAAREASRWLAESGKNSEAIEYLADAFAISGLKTADPDAAVDRDLIEKVYRKVHGSEVGLGDLILKAYDNTAALLAARRAEISELDPNTQIKDPMHFTLTGLNGDRLPLSSLLGKVVVLDFWATWCGPCRVQHPLYEAVKQRFKDADDLVFLSIDTDEDRSVVKPYVESQHWTQRIYFDDGLQYLLKVASIPTTIVFGKKGEVVSRMNGFLPDRFVDMLSERIEEALGRPAGAKPSGASGH